MMAVGRAARQKRIRAMIKSRTMVRKVWLLPSGTVNRVVDYQEERLLRSEVEAARELLDTALRAKGL